MTGSTAAAERRCGHAVAPPTTSAELTAAARAVPAFAPRVHATGSVVEATGAAPTDGKAAPVKPAAAAGLMA